MAITGLAAHDQDDDGQGAAARPSQPQPRQQARPRQPRREAPEPEPPAENPAPEPDTSTVEAPAQPAEEGPFGVAGPALADPDARVDVGLANLGDRMTFAKYRWGRSATDILGALGVEKPGHITNPNDACRQLDLQRSDKESA